MNIYECDVGNTILSDSQFTSKYNDLVLKWV